MKIKDIQIFFQEVDQRLPFPIQVILTGGAAAAFFGVDRVTYDIDFEAHIKLKRVTGDRWTELEKILNDVSQITHITPQFAEDIDRWSTIALPLKKSRLFEKIGKVEVRLLEPSLWAVGKLTRFLRSDLSDLIAVLKESKAEADECVKIWGQALGMSPPSSAQSLFQKQVIHFLEQNAKTIWGLKTDLEKLKVLFVETSRKSRKKR